jgi:hypothetical protein
VISAEHAVLYPVNPRTTRAGVPALRDGSASGGFRRHEFSGNKPNNRRSPPRNTQKPQSTSGLDLAFPVVEREFSREVTDTVRTGMEYESRGSVYRP